MGSPGFSVMYASLSFETCIVETLVRDRFTHRLKRKLPLAAVLARGASLNLIVGVLIRPRRVFLTYMHIIHIIAL